jgi:hypothetical protein
MADGRTDRIEALFHQAADLPPEGQRALLDAACAADPGLRAEVERLLARDARLRADDGPAAFLDSPLVRPPRGRRGSATTVSCACSAKGAWGPSTKRNRTTPDGPSPSR